MPFQNERMDAEPQLSWHKPALKELRLRMEAAVQA